MGKITETRKLYKETLKELTKTEENWLSFLDSSSWNFKYDFADQILIYAQRPEATACADIETWNNKVKRWINKNANGIFIFDNNENSQYPFKLVFDVSDTHNYKGTPYKLWSVEEKYQMDIIESLDATFGAESENLDLSTSITLNAYNMVTDNIQDYMSSIKKYIKGTKFEEYSDRDIYNIFVPCVWGSVSYMMMTRCGINAREKIDIKEFSYIKEFNNDNLITILGQAVSDIAELGLREIAKTIKIAHLLKIKIWIMLMIKKKLKEELIMEKITYTKVGDYNIPNLVMEREKLPDGKYARMRLHYLKTQKKAEYTILLMNKELAKHLSQIQEQATKMIKQIVEKMAIQEGTNEELKMQDQMKWTGLMNNYKMIAEEQIMAELIYN